MLDEAGYEPRPILARGNLFDAAGEPLAGERFDQLVAGSKFRLERIVSTGQATPPSEWYDQSDDEWVVLLSGSATLTIAGHESTSIRLSPGDWILLPAHCRHRVEQTSPDEATVWLALHMRPATPADRG